MGKNAILLTIAGVALGFILGFLIANSVNRTEINGLRAQLDAARSAVRSSSENEDRETLSADEIKLKIDEADQNPNNADYQKNLGLALYRYGAFKNDPDVISQSIRLLERASNLTPNDKDVTIGLGNAWFDIGYIKKDSNAFEKSREFYSRMLAGDANNADVRTDLGMTYFLQEPPDDTKATAEFKRALAADPKNEKALEFVVQSLSRQGNYAEAAKYLDTLRQSHPQNESLASLSAQVGQNQPQ
jgi:tetratricopeptide (TPR) repeat protein